MDNSQNEQRSDVLLIPNDQENTQQSGLRQKSAKLPESLDVVNFLDPGDRKHKELSSVYILHGRSEQPSLRAGFRHQAIHLFSLFCPLQRTSERSPSNKQVQDNPKPLDADIHSGLEPEGGNAAVARDNLNRFR
jgi:hypothetical protein